MSSTDAVNQMTVSEFQAFRDAIIKGEKIEADDFLAKVRGQTPTRPTTASAPRGRKHRRERQAQDDGGGKLKIGDGIVRFPDPEPVPKSDAERLTQKAAEAGG